VFIFETLELTRATQFDLALLSESTKKLWEKLAQQYQNQEQKSMIAIDLQSVR
jgi:hypothetical protein